MEWCTIRYSRHQFYLHLYSNYDGRELPGLVYDKEFVSVDREDFPEKAPFLLGIAQITPPPPCIQAIWTTFHLKKKKVSNPEVCLGFLKIFFANDNFGSARRGWEQSVYFCQILSLYVPVFSSFLVKKEFVVHCVMFNVNQMPLIIVTIFLNDRRVSVCNHPHGRPDLGIQDRKLCVSWLEEVLATTLASITTASMPAKSWPWCASQLHSVGHCSV